MAGNIISHGITESTFPCLIGRMDSDETQIIKRVLAGDRDAYRVLVESHYQYAFRIAYRLAGQQSDAEEITQEAFLRAYTKLSTFRHDSTFSTWVNRITMNIALNLLERRKRDLSQGGEQISESHSSRVLHQVSDRRPGPERLLLDKEFTSLRQIAMEALTPMERTAFTLRHVEEMPIAEIASALRVPPNSAKQAVFRAVSKLRKSLAPAFGGSR